MKKLLIAALLLPALARAADVLEKPQECLVCGVLHTSAVSTAEYKGRKLYLCSETCLEKYRSLERAGTLDSITAKIEPRAALFQEDSNPKRQLASGYFLAGLYVLAGLACGGLASYLAIQKGLAGWPAFGLGLAFNFVGLVLVATRQGRAMPFTSKGLTKIPSTRDEISCPACGHSNHPSAERCSACSTALQPQSPSEVRLAGLRREA